MQAKWKCSVLIGALAAMAMSCAAEARWPADRVSVDIIDRSDGRVLTVYTHEGRRYVIGKPGNEYAIRVRNEGGDRALAVMSVDGVNVISGDTASPAQTGYVLDAHSSSDIAGWRTSRSRTAAFFFTTLANSYATRTDRPDNVGVIGVAVFHERPRPPALQQFGGKLERRDQARNEVDRAASASASGAASSPMPAAPPSQALKDADAMTEKKSQIGTGYGRGETSYVQYTSFERASDTPSETITIFYDSYENLLAQGVPVSYAPIARARPEPFPDAGRFAPPPR